MPPRRGGMTVGGRARKLPAIPPALRVPLQRARMALDGWNAPGTRVLCALGGGADSALMLHVMVHLGARMGFSVAAVHVNHGLTASAATLETAARDAAEACAVPLCVEQVTVKPNGEGVEAAARHARHQALARVAHQQACSHLALGHTATDVAETFLQRVLEGAGRGQDVMRAVERGVLRPLLTQTRAQVRLAAEAAALPFVDDPMNQDPALLRGYLRHHVFAPLVARMGAVDATLARAAGLAAADHDALEQWARQAWEDGSSGVHAKRAVLAALPTAVCLRALRQMVDRAAEKPVRTGSEACRKMDAALRVPGGRVRRFKAGPVWLVLQRERVLAVPAGGVIPGEEP